MFVIINFIIKIKRSQLILIIFSVIIVCLLTFFSEILDEEERMDLEEISDEEFEDEKQAKFS